MRGGEGRDWIILSFLCLCPCLREEIPGDWPPRGVFTFSFAFPFAFASAFAFSFALGWGTMGCPPV